MATSAWGLAIRLTRIRRDAPARPGAASALAPVRGGGRAVDAQPGLGFGLEPGGGDGLAAALASAVGVLVELGEGVFHVLERLHQVVAQRLVLTALRGHLAR